MNEIEKLDEWLESKAIASENDQYWIDRKKEDPNFSNFWPSYYRNLKNVNSLKSFTLSSIHWKGDVLIEYLNSHKDEYERHPSTGSCFYVKKSLGCVK